MEENKDDADVIARRTPEAIPDSLNLQLFLGMFRQGFWVGDCIIPDTARN